MWKRIKSFVSGLLGSSSSVGEGAGGGNPNILLDAYYISGNVSPDCRGTYEWAGTYNNKRYYKKPGSLLYIWWLSASNAWIISYSPGLMIVFYWYRISSDIIGEYTPVPQATGVANVSIGQLSGMKLSNTGEKLFSEIGV